MVSTGEGTSGLEDNNILFGMTSGSATLDTTTHSASSTFQNSSSSTTMIEVSGLQYALLRYLQTHLDLSDMIS